MNDRTTFIDFERFVKWIYENSHLLSDYYDKPLCVNTAKTWKRYSKMPSNEILELINEKLLSKDDEKFEKIDGIDLLLCANNAKDHNRGNIETLASITSTGKKILTLLILGRIIDEDKNSNFFLATKEKNQDVWKYLSGFNKSNNSVKKYYYFPGRTVSCKQLCDVGKKYKNGIKDTAIPDGLKELENKGLVECVGKDLYKLSFNGCKNFLIENMY